MADLATYLGVSPQTIIIGAAAVSRGYRVTRGSDSKYVVQDNTARGDMVTLRDGAIGEAIDAVPAGTPARCAAFASEAANDGDLAYTAAGGAFSKTSTSNVLMGRWIGTVAANTLGVVELFTVA